MSVNIIDHTEAVNNSDIPSTSSFNYISSTINQQVSTDNNEKLSNDQNLQQINIIKPMINISNVITSININQTCNTKLLQYVRHDHSYCRKIQIEPVHSNEGILHSNSIIHQEDDCFSHISNIQENFLGDMIIECIHCKAKHFHGELVPDKGTSFNDCCSHGKVELPINATFPNELEQLFNGDHELSQQFFQSIRLYNTMFSFASFNANIIDFNNTRPGPYCFKIQGRIYYQFNTSLHPPTGDKPTFGQLFIIDANEAIEHRMAMFNNAAHIDIIKLLENIMRNHNIFAKSYEMMREEIKKQENAQTLQELQLLFSMKDDLDKRRYNCQQSNEVAAIFSTTADGDIPDAYVVVRNKNTKELKKISTMDPNVDSWVYPLFNPYGQKGWHKNIAKKNSEGNVSRAAYTKYNIAIRDNFNPLLRGRRLFQQYVVDTYVKIEKDRIEYCKSHQDVLKVSSYKSLIEYVKKKAQGLENARVGKIVVLPSTFIGSPRYMLQLYHDSMTQTQKIGKPDLFITMTCNPNWKEIKNNLLPGQQPSDRPDLITRVFNLKKNQLIDFIIKKKFFGHVSAYLYVIEFQKRGLPHCHILVTLSANYKLTTIRKIDRFISAEIPNPDRYPKLHEIVINHMIHGPCGDRCLNNGKCSKKFPKPYQDETIIDSNSYPIYRRRNTNQMYVRKNNHKVDNRNVVPYCPELLLMFNCHINVEVCSSIQSIKYLHKYIYKGHDAASVVITNNDEGTIVNHDEIKTYINARYVGPSEAVWRILSKPLHDKSHVIIRLPVHLPNYHNVVIHTDPHIEDAESALNQVSMLMDYFALNKRDPEARKYLYSDIPIHYTFLNKENQNGIKEKKWRKRRKFINCFGRMYSVSPTQTELFHLRILLMRVKGATSFDHLKTVNGVVHESFTSACLALGLIENDEEWSNSMREAAVFMMPKQLRNLYVRILIHCNPLDPLKLWNDYKNMMSEDFARNYNQNYSYVKAIHDIQSILQREGKSLNDYPQLKNLYQLLTSTTIPNDDHNDISNDELLNIGLHRMNNMNVKQKEITERILKTALNCHNEYNQKNCFFIDGPGGSGKTYVYETIWHILKGHNKKICMMSFTGIAATLLPQGKTAHKILKLPVPLLPDSTANIELGSDEANYLKDTDVFIWDEAPMAPRYAIEIMDRILRDIMNNNHLFGGKIVILGGDFRQLLPVNVNGTRTETINLCINRTSFWSKFTKFSLTENMRALPEEKHFAKFLLDVGDGKMNDSGDNFDLDNFPREIVSTDFNLVNDIYGDIIKKKDYKKAIDCAILSARNDDVNDINNEVINLLDETTEKIYSSIDSTDNCDNDGFDGTVSLEFLNSINIPSLPPHELRLRTYCIIMLIRNLNISEGLCNGTRLMVLELMNNILKCEILTGDKKGQITFINRITLYSSTNDYPIVFKRRQFPVKIAFAITINKAQGQTFEKIGIDLRKDVFNHGQLYVALSRVRSWNSLKIYLNDENKKSIKNYVYKELFV
ncbi:hypothetical protein TKK_0011797 [Trichogramma kaykai]